MRARACACGWPLLSLHPLPPPSSVAQAKADRAAMYTESEKRKMKEAQHVDMTMEDPEVEALRQRRLEALKNASKARAQHLADGHGELREIVEEEFLREVTSTKCVVGVVE
jgi:hypothetical protein